MIYDFASQFFEAKRKVADHLSFYMKDPKALCVHGSEQGRILANGATLDSVGAVVDVEAQVLGDTIGFTA